MGEFIPNTLSSKRCFVSLLSQLVYLFWTSLLDLNSSLNYPQVLLLTSWSGFWIQLCSWLSLPSTHMHVFIASVMILHIHVSFVLVACYHVVSSCIRKPITLLTNCHLPTVIPSPCTLSLECARMYCSRFF